MSAAQLEGRISTLPQVLEAAVNGRADALITHNARHFEKSATISGLRLLRPGELLKELRS